MSRLVPLRQAHPNYQAADSRFLNRSGTWVTESSSVVSHAVIDLRPLSACVHFITRLSSYDNEAYLEAARIP